MAQCVCASFLCVDRALFLHSIDHRAQSIEDASDS